MSRAGAVQDVRRYLTRRHEQHVADLAQFVAIPSVSAFGGPDRDLSSCAGWLAERLVQAGLEHVEIIATRGSPVVYGDWLHAGSDRPTVLVYGHYDVQPADISDGWSSDPFAPAVRNGCLYGRGASDNKGSVLAHLVAVEASLSVDRRLPCNVRFVIEGEEEIGSANFGDFLDSQSGKLQADFAHIADSSLNSADVPGMAISRRGSLAVGVALRTAERDLHSGIYGGPIPNAAHALSTLLATLHDQDGDRVLVDRFYERVVLPSDAGVHVTPDLTADALRDSLGVQALRRDESFSPQQQIGTRPTLEVHGMAGGYSANGDVRWIIPSVARATMSCRLVPDQDPDEILRYLVSHLHTHTPRGGALEIEFAKTVARPLTTNVSGAAAKAARESLAAIFGTEAKLYRGGGTVPAAAMISERLGLECIFLGFAAPEENPHGIDEHFHLRNLRRGAESAIEFWARLPDCVGTSSRKG